LGQNCEIVSALYGASGNEVSLNPRKLNPAFVKPFPDAHIYVMNDKRIIDGFSAVGAEERVFGKKPMKPAVNILRSRKILAA
jgi:hypothetical protein